MPAARASHPREPVSQDAAAEVAAKVPFHPSRNTPAHGVGFLRLGEKGLQMMLDHRVERCFGGAAGAIDGAGSTVRRRRGRARPSTGGMGRSWGMGGHLPSHGESVGQAMAGSARRCHLRRWDRSRSPGGRARSGGGSGPAPWAAGVPGCAERKDFCMPPRRTRRGARGARAMRAFGGGSTAPSDPGCRFFRHARPPQ